MKLNDPIHPLEAQMQKLAEGYLGFPEPHFPLGFRDPPLLPVEVTASLTRHLDLFAEVRRCQAKLEVAIEARDRAIPKVRAFVREASQVARHHFGADPKKMASFGMTCPTRRKPSRSRRQSSGGEHAVTTVIEEVITTCEEAPRQSQAPTCREERGTRPCRGKRAPGRAVKRGCEEAKRCGARGSRGGERRAK